MAKQSTIAPLFLRWSKRVSISEIQDPLSLGLRGSTRLANLLLPGITSITPRARYFSFLVWCIYDWQNREKGESFALALRDAITVRENALTLGCIVHHKGDPCEGGALVGTRQAKQWFQKGKKEASLKKLKFAKNPAFDAYFNSMNTLRLFVTDDQMDADDIDGNEFTFEDIELSSLGKKLAKQYDGLVSGLASVRSASTQKRDCSLASLREWGKRGGFCELSQETAPDRDLLRDVFFARISLEGESHSFRRQSLLLILDLCRQLSKDNWILGQSTFNSAVYFGEIVSEGDSITLSWPKSLRRIADRWRMFYFHHYMSVALEGLFAWLVTRAAQQGLTGVSIEGVAKQLDSVQVRKEISELFGIKVSGKFGQLSPIEFLGKWVEIDTLDSETSKRLDETIRPTELFSEDKLEDLIRNQAYLQSSTGLAIPLVLLATTLSRYFQWEGTDLGNWLAKVPKDTYFDLVPTVLAKDLNQRFGNWWELSWRKLAEFILSRYVVQQHQSLAYVKTALGDRCLLQVDGDKILSTGVYEKIGMGNPRLRSAIQILTDLGLLMERKDGVKVLTRDGKTLLREELAKDVEK